MTMNDSWGYKSGDHNWKSTADLIRKLVDIVSKGGNFLLNVGPTEEGLIPAPSVERLTAVGAWLEQNAAAVYGTVAGPVQGIEERFPDMSEPYDSALQKLALGVAGELGISLSRGTYAALLGPSYETPAEIRQLERAGAHAVGMSTVPEAITARALGLRVVAFSLVTNRAAGLGSATLDHQEVLEVGKQAGKKLEDLIRALIRELGERPPSQ